MPLFQPAAAAELLRHKVAFLRDQQYATNGDQGAFARLLGPLTKPHPTVAGDVPVGTNGDTSIVRRGDASHYPDFAA